MIVGKGVSLIEAKRKETNEPIRITKIEHNVRIRDVEEVKSDLFKKGLVNFKYSFEIKYMAEEEVFGEINIEGNVMYTGEKVKDILKKWEKDKKIDPEIFKEIFDAVINESLIEGMVLAKKILLPPPIRLPTLKLEKTNKYIG